MDINQLHEKASDLLADGNLEEAEKLYNNILELAPNDESALSALMDIYEQTDKFRYYLARANYNIVNGKLEYAINDCKKALNLDAENIEAREKMARLLKVTNKPLKAIDEFSRIIEIEPSHFTSYMELIELYSKEDALESALEIAKKGQEIFKDRANFEDVMAKLYFDMGDYENALSVVKNDGLKIKILLQDEKNDEAYEILKGINLDSPELKPEEKAFYSMLFAQYYYNISNYDKAFEYIDKYVGILGPNPIGFQMKALCYEGKNDSFMAAYNFGYMNKALGKTDDALVEFNNAYTINPKNKDVLIELAKIYELNKEKYTAIDFWQKVYEIDEDETAKSILIDFYTKEGDIQAAQRYGAVFEPSEQNPSYKEPEVEEEGFLDKIINLFAKK